MYLSFLSFFTCAVVVSNSLWSMVSSVSSNATPYVVERFTDDYAALSAFIVWCSSKTFINP